jgi:hypothetical protein
MEFREYIIEAYGSSDEILFADGLDEAIIGFEQNNCRTINYLYIYKKTLAKQIYKFVKENINENS